MLLHVFREEMFEHSHTEFYQYSAGMHMEYDRPQKAFAALELHGEPIDDERLYTIGLQDFHFVNFQSCFGFPKEEVLQNAKARVMSTSIRDEIIENFAAERIMSAEVEGRIMITE